MVNPKNASAAKQMLEIIAQRSGEDRSNVFLDIIIDIIFHKGESDVWMQQELINRISEMYGIKPPVLISRSGEVPF